MVDDYLCCRIPAHHSRGAPDRYRGTHGRCGGAPEFCLCHRRLLYYRTPFLLAFPVAARLPPILSARFCHWHRRSSDGLGPLDTASGYREDLASRAPARLVWRIPVIGGRCGSPFVG